MPTMTRDAWARPVGYAALFVAMVAFDPVAYEPHHVRWIAAAIFVLALANAGRGSAAATGTTTDKVISAALALGVGVAAASLFWSADPAAGLAGLSHLVIAALLFGYARTLPHDARTTVATIVANTIPVVLTLWASDAAAFGGIGNPNFLTETLLLAAPFAAMAAALRTSLGARVWYAACCAVALGVSIFVLPSQAGILGAAAATGVFILAWLRGRLQVGAAIGAALAIALVLAQGIDTARFSNSLASRTQLWSNAATIWQEHPVVGIGFGSFDALYPSYQERHLANLPPTAPARVLLDRKNIRAGAVHNEPLQFLATLGIVGAAIALVFGVGVGVGVRIARSGGSSTSRAANAAILAGLAGLATIASVGFPLQLPHTQILGVLLVAFALPVGGGGPPLPSRRWARVAASAALLAIAIQSAGTAIGQHLLGRSLATMRIEPERAAAMAQSARLFAPADHAVRVWSFVALVRWTELETARVPDRKRVDDAYRAANLPANSSLLVQSARLQYLVNFGETDADIAEAQALADWLTAVASRIQDNWILAAALAMRKGSFVRALECIEIAAGLRRADALDAHRALVEAMRAVATNEIASGSTRPLRPQINVVFDRV